MSRKEALSDLNKCARRLDVIEKALNNRKPLLEKHDRELAARKQAAIRRLEDLWRKKTGRHREESRKLQEEFSLLSKRIVEMSNEVTKTTPPSDKGS